MAALGTDPGFRLNALERWLLAALKVPEAAEPPDGSPESIRVFRAGRNYYRWSLIMWASATCLAGLAAASISMALVTAVLQAPEWGQIAAVVGLILVWSLYIGGVAIALISCRVDYGLRWYIVTDRSLRIRSGIFRMSELTMTYSNVQEIRVRSGPLQLLLGIADVEVQAAGGGGDGQHGGGGHAARFTGVAQAEAIRDLIVERLRHYRDSGLGDTAHAAHVAAPQPATALAAARIVLDEARALRAALESAP